MKVIISLLALLPAAALAGSFDGTWKMRPDATQFASKPEIYSLKGGQYDCGSCVPKISIRADGTDQPVTGHPYFDTVAVRATGDTTARIVYKKSGKVMFENQLSVSADHNTLSVKWTDQSGTQPGTGENLFRRAAGQAAVAPAGANAISGTWQYDSIRAVNDNALLTTFAETADGLKMSSPTGQSFDAKYDGKEVPVQGDAAGSTVSLKRVGPREIEETLRVAGKVSDVITMRVSADGRKIVLSDEDKWHDRTDVFVLDRQP